MDAAKKALSGHGRPVNAGPSERRWSEGTRRNAPGWIEGQVFLVPFGTIAKRNSPGRAKPFPTDHSENGPANTPRTAQSRQGDAGVAEGSCLSPEAPHHLPGAASSTAPRSP